MAYADVASLKQKLERLLYPREPIVLLPKPELQSIYDDLCYWQSFLQSTSSIQSINRVNALQTQFKDLAHELEDMIESYIIDRIHSEYESPGDASSAFRFFQEIVQIKAKINSLTKRLKAKKMVGLDGEVIKLLDWLCREPSSSHKSLSIVGMAGIGKTQLANEVYCHPVVTYHFDLRLFLPIGPQYQLEQVLLLAHDQLSSQEEVEMGGRMDAGGLGEHLYARLTGRRFLVVLDDIWNAQVLRDLKKFIPIDRNGSRIIMTTRLLGVYAACTAGISTLVVPFMNDDESWNLLRETVFTSDQEPWDPQLEKIGRKIAKNCEGLPLAIIEVGRLLCKTERKVECWKEIEEREDPLVITIDDGTPISNTLSLSYKMLPRCLKSCFLYMGVFPKDYEIPTSKLIQLWVSEGFIEQPLSGKSLEKRAEEYLNDLVFRSLVLVCKCSSSDRIKTCRIHFVFRNICISEAHNENLFHIIKKYPQGTDRQRGLCFHNNTVLGFKGVHSSLLESVPTARSLLCFGPQHQHPLRVYLHFPSLSVLDAVTIRFYKFPQQVVELVQLRYLAITYDGEIPPSISALCDLEVLIVRRHHESLKHSKAPVYLPMEIWKLHKLRHLKCMGHDLLDPTSVENGSANILENLLTLSGVSAHSCTRGVLGRMPSLTKLGVRIESPHDVIEISNLFRDFRFLKRLVSCKCIVENPSIGSQVVSFAPYFPTGIRKLTLQGCRFSWRDMTYIGSIPNLQVLKLRRCAFRGPEWETSEREFRGLKVLLLEDLDIQHWIISPRCHFPNLRRFIIRHCYRLQEIPHVIGCLSKLEMIEVDDCSPTLVISAQQIQQQRRITQKKSLEFRIHSSWDDKIKSKPPLSQ